MSERRFDDRLVFIAQETEEAAAFGPLSELLGGRTFFGADDPRYDEGERQEVSSVSLQPVKVAAPRRMKCRRFMVKPASGRRRREALAEARRRWMMTSDAGGAAS
jgi:hypothetical protein